MRSVKHIRMTAASFAAVFSPLAVLSPLVALAVSLAWALPALGGDLDFTERVISTTAGGARSVFATDVDGDGDTDVLSASNEPGSIVWYESDGGTPPSINERVISTTASGAFSVFATDVDGDGDIDVLSASELDDKIAWYENDGGLPPTFTERVISTTAHRAVSVFAANLDGDGDIDILSASWEDDTIAWYENKSGDCPADFDGDGDVDAADLAVLLGSWGSCEP